MRSKEGLIDIFPKKDQVVLQKNFTDFTEYFQKANFWYNYTLEFLNSPIEIGQIIFNFKNDSPEKKAKIMSLILSDNRAVNVFYLQACINLHKKCAFKTNCVSYASFVSTFSQWMNPENETTLYFGSATINQSPNPEKIGTQSEHFWVTINDKLFDNSNPNGISYTDHQPLLKIEDILSGEFDLQPVIITP